MTKILDLPREMVEEIVSRVPLKSMRAVRLACKKWYTLFKSESFLKMHIGKQEGESRMIVAMNFNLYLMNIVLDVDPYTKHIAKLTCLDEQVKIYEVFHCEGLLLCILKDDTRVVVWNPYLGQPRWIETRYVFCGNLGSNEYSYALGYVNNKETSSHSYRILRFFDDYDIISYELYDFDSGLWKTLDFTPHFYNASAHHNVSVKGNSYWFATERYISKVTDSHIICFDYTKERFGSLLPLPYITFCQGLVGLSCVRDEKLVVVYQDWRDLDVTIWITSKVEAETVSWSKFLTTGRRPLELPYIWINYAGGGFIIEEEKKVAVVFDNANASVLRNTVKIIGKDGYCREVDSGELVAGSRPHLCSYFPSLVQIKQPAQDKKTQLNYLEELRYNH